LLKGLLVSKKYEHVYVKMRLTDNLELFKKQRGDLLITAQIKIAYHWRKKLKWLRANAKQEVLEIKSVETKKSGVQSKIKPYIDGKSSLRNRNNSRVSNNSGSIFNKQKTSK
jgi:hypothetical protein